MRITCNRCGQASDALTLPPMPTALGGEIQEKICPAGWREWLGMQVMLINEYRFNLMDQEARRALEGQMRAFLKLPSDHPE